MGGRSSGGLGGRPASAARDPAKVTLSSDVWFFDTKGAAKVNT